MTTSSIGQGVRFPLPPAYDDGTSAFQHGPLRIMITPSEDHGEDGQWRHVSVSLQDRLPTYEELGAVRSAYFPAEATVVQVMPPESQWVNEHQFCLHLWQRLDTNLLPHGLHSSVGVRGSIPNDALEVQLIRSGHQLAAMLHNLLRVRGRVTVQDACEALRPVFKDATDQQLRYGLRVAFLDLVCIAPGVSQANRNTFIYAAPSGVHPVTASTEGVQ